MLNIFLVEFKNSNTVIMVASRETKAEHLPLTPKFGRWKFMLVLKFKLFKKKCILHSE